MANPRKPLRPPGATQKSARAGFWEAVDSLCPDAADELLRTVGPPFDAYLDYVERTRLDAYWGTYEGMDRTRRPELAALAAPVLTALHAWAKPRNLHLDTWTLEQPIRALGLWRTRHLATKPATFGLSIAGEGVGYVVPASTLPAPEGYDPLTEKRADYLARVKHYADAVEATYAAAGWQEAPHRPTAPTHLQWTVRYQLRGETFPAIAAGKKDPDFIKKMVRDVATLIGLTRRGGR
jgi:hypothetical protein